MKLTITGILIAIGLIIPMFSPVKILIEPASFTLASHVAIFIAMFISPAVAVSVAVGTTLGFLLGGFPIIIVFRAATHVIFALFGSLYIHKISKERLSVIKLRIFSFCIAAIHAVGELVVVSIFYFGGNISPAHIEHGFITSVLLLVGLGTVIHSMIDFEIAHVIILPIKKIFPEYFAKN
jgi:niacin transporter